MNVGRRLPPLTALRAFEAAGRHLSFTRAADELRVTPTAVSQQVRLLEDFIGVVLLRRKGRGLELTEAGRACFPDIQDSFDRMSASFDRLEHRDRGEVLTISVSPCFGTIWLAPRLPSFQRAHPDIDVRVLGVIHSHAVGRYTSDIGIRFMPAPFAGMKVEPLMPERIFPVCTPRLAESGKPLRKMSDLRHHALLHDETARVIPIFPSWRMWFEAAGVTGVNTERGPRLSLSSMVIQCALRDEGVALGRSVLIAEDLAAGRLIRPFDFEYPDVFYYYLVAADASAGQPKVGAFWQWILDEAHSATPSSA